MQRHNGRQQSDQLPLHIAPPGIASKALVIVHPSCSSVPAAGPANGLRVSGAADNDRHPPDTCPSISDIAAAYSLPAPVARVGWPR